MTDEEMAEEYCNKLCAEKVKNEDYDEYGHILYRSNEMVRAFLAGLQAGRPEWHKVADGDLPKDKEYVLIYTDLNNYYVAEKIENHFMSKGWGFIPMSTVIAWCETPTFDKE